MNKKVKKILLVLAILLLSIFPILVKLYASDYNGIISKLKPGGSTDNKINEIGSEILGYIQWIGVAFLLAAIITAGIAAVTSTTADKKSDFKSAIWGFSIGAILILAPTIVIRLVLEFKMQE